MVQPARVLILTTFDLDEYVYHALRAGASGFLPSTATRPTPVLDLLTSREAEVLKLVGHALSNTEVAARLCVSEATVKTHLNRAMAYESGLVTPGQETSRPHDV